MTNIDRDRNLVAAICYIPIFSVVIALIILFVEKEDRFIRFHAIQAFLFSLIYYIAVFVLGGFPYVGGLIAGLIFVLAIIVWIWGMMSSYKGQIFNLPYIGKFAEKRVE